MSVRKVKDFDLSYTLFLVFTTTHHTNFFLNFKGVKTSQMDSGRVGMTQVWSGKIGPQG